MSKGTASTLVLVSGGVLVGLALLDSGSLASGSAYRRIWAAGLLTVGLGVAADFVPEIVGPFAALVIIASVAKNPGRIGSFITGKPAAAPLPAKVSGSGTTVNPAVDPRLSGPVQTTAAGR